MSNDQQGTTGVEWHADGYGGAVATCGDATLSVNFVVELDMTGVTSRYYRWAVRSAGQAVFGEAVTLYDAKAAAEAAWEQMRERMARR